MDLNNLHQSRTVRLVLIGITIALAVIIVFEAGVFVGFRKASFSYRLGDNYYRAFRGGRPMMMSGFDGDNIPGGHGASGKIIKIALPDIVIADDDNVEKTIVIGSSTVIKRFDQTVSPQDIRVDDFVVALGSPDTNSQIQAKFIRLLPPPQEDTATTSLK
jgi:hypothetical protein